MHQFKHYYNHLHNFQSNCIQSAHTKVYEGQIMSWWDTCSSSLHSTWCRAAMFVYGNPRGMNFLRSWQQESFINEVVLFTNKVNMVHNWNIKQIYQKIKTKSRSSPPPPSLQSMCFSTLRVIFHVLCPESLRWSIYFMYVSSVKVWGHIIRYILKRTTSNLQAYLLLSAVSRKRPERGLHMFYNGGLAQLPANRLLLVPSF